MELCEIAVSMARRVRGRGRVTSSVLHDAAGHVGYAQQALTIRPRQRAVLTQLAASFSKA